LHARLHQQLLRGLHALGFECDRVLWPVAFFVPHPDARGEACRSDN
jgi:hypothetical protein